MYQCHGDTGLWTTTKNWSSQSYISARRLISRGFTKSLYRWFCTSSPRGAFRRLAIGGLIAHSQQYPSIGASSPPGLSSICTGAFMAMVDEEGFTEDLQRNMRSVVSRTVSHLAVVHVRNLSRRQNWAFLHLWGQYKVSNKKTNCSGIHRWSSPCTYRTI